MQETRVQSLDPDDPREKGILQNSCLENSGDRGAWWAVVHVNSLQLIIESKNDSSCLGASDIWADTNCSGSKLFTCEFLKLLVSSEISSK